MLKMLQGEHLPRALSGRYFVTEPPRGGVQRPGVA
jgi:hypothetical protein